MDLHDPFGIVVCQTRLGRTAAAAYLGVSTRTLDRWIKNDSAPLAARRALAWLTGRADGWRGFRFQGKTVVTPTGHVVHRNQVDNLEWYTRLQRRIGRDEALSLPQDLGGAAPKPPLSPARASGAGAASLNPSPRAEAVFG